MATKRKGPKYGLETMAKMPKKLKRHTPKKAKSPVSYPVKKVGRIAKRGR